MLLKINKDYFKNLEKGTHDISIGFTDGKAEGSFMVDDAITFYLHGDYQIPLTATKGMTWADWIMSYNMGTSGNNILWVGFDNKTLYLDPRTDHPELKACYGNYELGSSSLEFINLDEREPESLSSVIQPGKTYGSRICCFDAGTQILMADNTLKNIEDIVIGDEIISYNEETKEFEKDKVTRTIIKENSDDLVYIKLSNGEQIGMRAYHPLLTQEGWKSLRPELAETVKDVHQKISELKIGDSLIGINESPVIIEIINRETPINYNTYNISVEKNHNYIANGVVAHNAGCK